jgi:hypothetical protein
MAKQTVVIKHLGLISTGKFFAAFTFIFGLLMTVISGILFAIISLFSVAFGLGMGDGGALMSSIVFAGMNLVTFAIMAVVMLIAYPIFGFIVGAAMALALNIVVKLSGGLSFNADIH